MQPVAYEVADYEEDSLAPFGGYAREVVPEAFANWLEECSAFAVAAPGTIPDGVNPGPTLDDLPRVSFDDPADMLPAGVLASTMVTASATPAFIRYGVTYFKARDGDIVFNDDVDWARDQDIDAGLCDDEQSILRVAMHETGHFMGLDHSELADAVMLPSFQACDTGGSQPSDDDFTGFEALYEPFHFAGCSPSPFSFMVPDPVAAPVELECRVFNASDATWHWGDGQGNNGTTVTHAYTANGQYRASVDFTPRLCPDEVQTIDLGSVYVCAEPGAEVGAPTWVDGLTYRMNNSAGSPPEWCDELERWDISQGGEHLFSVLGREPTLTFDAPGTYDVMLTVVGVGGIVEAESAIVVTDGSPRGCRSIPGGPWWLALTTLGFTRRRRYWR
jgi:hypothetical protein